MPPRAVAAAPHSSVPAAAAVPAAPSVIQPPPPPPVSLQPQPAAASPFGGAPPAPSARQPVFQAAGGDQTFVPAESNPGATPPPPPPVTLPTDVQNQLIKFFGLDSFGIPGLTGNHPNGFAGAVQVCVLCLQSFVILFSYYRSSELPESPSRVYPRTTCLELLRPASELLLPLVSVTNISLTLSAYRILCL